MTTANTTPTTSAAPPSGAQNQSLLVKKVAHELKLQDYQVHAVIALMDDDCTVPFIARYRKERTGSLDEVQVRGIKERFDYLTDLEKTKEKYLAVIRSQAEEKPEIKARLSEIEKMIRECSTKQKLDDIYLPFKPKRRTKAQVAREKGLEPLFKALLEQSSQISDLFSLAKDFVKTHPEKPALSVKNEAEALLGASDIYAEQISETIAIRDLVRELSHKTGRLTASAYKLEDALGKNPDAKKVAKFEAKQEKFRNYFSYDEPLLKIPPHRIMAVRRGEAEKCLRVSIEVDEAGILDAIYESVTSELKPTPALQDWLKETVKSSYRRLLAPTIETELRLEMKEHAEKEAIRVFSDNLSKLLLLPPIPQTIVCGIDPGIKTGSKCAIVSATGKYLDSLTIYPGFESGKEDSKATIEAKAVLTNLLKTHRVEYIAIGNGTGSERIGQLVADILKSTPEFAHIKRLIVNEAGASVYSADDIAREEFPDLDTSIRGAISIARRLQDPLAELVKIDPRSIGVGQYQHDVNAAKLTKSLGTVVESCVNHVGVDLNTASYKLLSYVSGIRTGLAKSITKHRDQHGAFKNRQDLMKVSGFGDKSFQQAAGFLRIKDADNPLDNSAVHPECYSIVERMAGDLSKGVCDIIRQEELVNSIPIEKYVDDTWGLPTLKDILAELAKPGRDPRAEGSRLAFSSDITSIEDLKVDMVLPGTVTNVTNFGAFVDIGVHHNGLIHISELSNQFVKDATQVIQVGEIIDVKVIDVDLKRKRISLSRKTGKPQPQKSAYGAKPKGKGGPAKRTRSKPKQRTQDKQHTLDDLMSKFNS